MLGDESVAHGEPGSRDLEMSLYVKPTPPTDRVAAFPENYPAGKGQDHRAMQPPDVMAKRLSPL
jgi:hypothetical protein